MTKNSGSSARSTNPTIRKGFFSNLRKPKAQKNSPSAASQPVVQQKVVQYAKNPTAHIVTKAMDPELNFLSMKVVHHLQNDGIILPSDEKVKWQDIEKHNPALATSRNEVEDFRHKVFKSSSLDAFAQRLVTSVRKNKPVE